MLLGPCVDIHRSPLNGRNYESYSEDPFLSARTAAAYVRGVQSRGIGAAVKHYTCNNQQTDQQRVGVETDERTLREIYLPAFEAAVREAGCRAVMNAYNRVNGEHCSENRHLLTEILKRDWGFEGFVVSDWRSVHGVRAASAGLDLEMPGPGRFLRPEAVAEELAEGRITAEEIDEKVRRLLGFAVWSESADPGMPRDRLDTPGHRDLARRVAEQSMVLLKNQPVRLQTAARVPARSGRADTDGRLLPFSTDRIRSIAVIGPNAEKARLGGGGSSSVTPFYTVSPLEGLRRLCGDAVHISYEEGCSLQGDLPVVYSEHLSTTASGRRTAGLAAEYFDSPDLSGPPVLTRIDRQIDFAWGWRSPGGLVPKNDFSVRWTGRIEPPVDGTYRLGVAAEDGRCRLVLGGNPVIDLWGGAADDFESRYAARSRAVEVDLQEGRPCDIRVEYAKRGNRASVRLEWEIPGVPDPVQRAAALAAASEAAVVFAGLSNQFEGGNNDRKDLALPGRQEELITAVSRANRNTAVVLIGGSPMAMEPWIEEVPAVLMAWYPGQEGGNAIARALFGRVNPSGKLPDTFPRRLEDNPSYGNYPGSGDTVRYAEGIFVGYRHYEKNGIRPLYPFGHGLSYTRFEYARLEVRPEVGAAEEGFTVSVDVTNAGPVAGREVVQLYVGELEPRLERPVKELRGFAKIEPAPGETRRVGFALDRRAFAFYDPKELRWTAEPGEFEITVGGSSAGALKTRLRILEAPAQQVGATGCGAVH